MADFQRIAPSFPFSVYVNETSTDERIALGVYVNETSTTPPTTVTTIPTVTLMGAGTI